VKHLLSRVRRRLSFANVTAAIALFVALSGTGYAAVALPSNSVAKRHIRTGAVAKSEIRTGAVAKSELRRGAVAKSEIRSGAVGKSELATNGVGAAEVRRDAIDTTELRDAGVALDDLSATARGSLTGTAAVTYRVAATSMGAAAGGNAKGVRRTATGEYSVDLGRDVSACQYAATLAGVKSEQPPVGLITAAPAGAALAVKTYNADGAAVDAPFHLLVAC
jgi:hypothetical protein